MITRKETWEYKLDGACDSLKGVWPFGHRRGFPLAVWGYFAAYNGTAAWDQVLELMHSSEIVLVSRLELWIRICVRIIEGNSVTDY